MRIKKNFKLTMTELDKKFFFSVLLMVMAVLR